MGNEFYETLIVEIRPRLQSANVNMILKKQLQNTQIILENDGFRVIFDDGNFKVTFVDLITLPDSISYFQSKEKFLSFRFSTKNDIKSTFGQYKVELLTLKDKDVNKNEENKFLRQNERYDFRCGNCTQILSKDVEFKRILPLPTDNIEPSNWFCHANENTIDLNPKIEDIFYSGGYAHINSKLINKNCIKTTKSHFVCKRCLFWLGLCINQTTFRIWFNTIAFNTKSISHKSLPLQDCFSAIKQVLNDAFLNFAKLILHCQSSEDQNDYLMLWIVEKKLKILVGNSACQLSDLEVAKVLFKYENGAGGALKDWQSDQSVSTVSVSKSMMVELLKELYRLNKYFPEDFSSSNDFLISYLTLYGKVL